jgi:hypothetical protein
MSTNVIKRTPAAGGPSYNPGDAFHVPDQGQYGRRDRDFHVGIDYAAPAGTQIPAASSGEVVYSGPSRGFHYAVMVRSTGPDGQDYYSVYGHVDPAGALPVGTKVSIGQPIGAVGTPHPDEGERSTGPHFHFQIATVESLKGAGVDIDKVPGPDGLGFSTGNILAFKNPNEFKGWPRADEAPYNALTYVPIRDGLTYQPAPHLAEAIRANQLLSGTNFFSRAGVSPADIDRFYAETGNPDNDPSGYPGNDVSRGVTGANNTVGFSPAELDGFYNFTQLGRSGTTPSTTNGLAPLNQTASLPWYSSPAVTGNYAPTDNFNWNNVPTGAFGFGNRGPSPAGPGGASSPVVREPRRDRRSAAPDGSAPASAQSAASPMGDFYANFPRVSTAAPASWPAASNGPAFGFDPRTTGDFNALAQRLTRLFNGVGQFAGNSLVPPAEAASQVERPSGPTTTDPLADEAQEVINNRPARHLSRRVANPSPASEPNPTTSAISDRQDSFNDRFGDWMSSAAGNAPRNSNQPASVPQASPPLGLFTGEPMPNYPVSPPIFGFPDNSGVSGDDGEDWLDRWIKPLMRQ